MTAFASRGSFSVLVKVTCRASSFQLIPKSRWTVWASVPVSSLIRLAARPVGAASTTSRPIFRNRAAMARTVVVFPVPGPPVRISTFSLAASSTALRCWGE